MKLSKKEVSLIYFLRCEGMSWRQISSHMGLPLGRHNQVSVAYHKSPMQWIKESKGKKPKSLSKLNFVR